MPQVDVIIPFFKNTQYLSQAIDSILNQVDVECYIHLVDDCSPEDVSAIQKKYTNTPRIYWYRNKENVGPYMSVHSVWDYLKTGYVFIQDSDDVAANDRVKISLEYLKNYSIVAGNMIQFVDSDADDKIKSAHQNKPLIKSGEICHSISSPVMIHGTLGMRTEFFTQLNGYVNERFGADSDFTTRAYHYNKDQLICCDKVLGYRRIHSNSLTHSEDTGLGTDARKQVQKALFGRCEEYVKDNVDYAKYGCLMNRTKTIPIFPGRQNVSCVMLSWDRPQNIPIIIDNIRRQGIIDDIVIWNNKLDDGLLKEILKDYDDVTVIESDRNVQTLGRFLATQYCKHDIIYTQDDDCLVDNIAQLNGEFHSNPSRITHNLSKYHYHHKYENIYSDRCQMALLGWGSMWKKEWVSNLLELRDKFVAELFEVCADRIFSICLDRLHNSLLGVITNFDEARDETAMFKRGNHNLYSERAVSQTLDILGIKHKPRPRAGLVASMKTEPSISIIMRISREEWQQSLQLAMTAIPHYEEIICAVSPNLPHTVVQELLRIPRLRIIPGAPSPEYAGGVHYQLMDEVKSQWMANVDDDDYWTYCPELIDIPDNTCSVYGDSVHVYTYIPKTEYFKSSPIYIPKEVSNHRGSCWLLKTEAWRMVREKAYQNSEFPFSDWRPLVYMLEKGWKIHNINKLFGVYIRSGRENTTTYTKWADYYENLM